MMQNVCTQAHPDVKTFQVDTLLNPTDALCTWRDAPTRKRHYAFLMGDAMTARKMWLESRRHETYKPKKIAPAPRDTSTTQA